MGCGLSQPQTNPIKQTNENAYPQQQQQENISNNQTCDNPFVNQAIIQQQQNTNQLQQQQQQSSQTQVQVKPLQQEKQQQQQYQQQTQYSVMQKQQQPVQYNNQINQQANHEQQQQIMQSNSICQQQKFQQQVPTQSPQPNQFGEQNPQNKSFVLGQMQAPQQQQILSQNQDFTPNQMIISGNQVNPKIQGQIGQVEQKLPFTKELPQTSENQPLNIPTQKEQASLDQKKKSSKYVVTTEGQQKQISGIQTQQSAFPQGQYVQKEENSTSSTKIVSVPVIYAAPGSNTAQDISGVLKGVSWTVYKSDLNSPHKMFEDISQSTLKAVQSQTGIILVVDICTAEGLVLVQQVKEKFNIPPEKLSLVILVPTLESPVSACGPSISYLSFYLILAKTSGCPVTFIEREYWYGQDRAMDIISNTIQKGQTCYIPNGNQTKQKLINLHEQFTKGCYYCRSFVIHLAMEGFSEQEVSNGKVVMDKLIAQPTANIVSPFQAKLCKENLIYRNKTKKLVIYQGTRTVQIATQISSQNLAGISVQKFSDLKKGLVIPGQQEVLILLDGNEKIPKQFTDSTIADMIEQTPIFLALLLPDSEQNFYQLIPMLNTVIDQFTGIILLSSSEVQNKNAEKFVLSLINGPVGFQELAYHLIPFPRLKFLTPFLSGQSLVNYSKAQINLTTRHSILGGVWYNCQLPQSQEVFVKVLARNFETDAIEGAYNMLPYPIWQLAGSNNTTTYENKCAILNHCISAIQFLQLCVSKQDLLEKYNLQEYQYDKQTTANQISNPNDLISEYETYSKENSELISWLGGHSINQTIITQK